jgi:hypothetical protein
MRNRHHVRYIHLVPDKFAQVERLIIGMAELQRDRASATVAPTTTIAATHMISFRVLLIEPPSRRSPSPPVAVPPVAISSVVIPPASAQHSTMPASHTDF